MVEGEIPNLWSLTPIGAFLGVVVFVTVSVLRGWVIPKSSHEREIAAANKRGDEWKETALESRTLNAELAAQLAKHADAARTHAEFYSTVMRSGGERRAETPTDP